MTGIRIEPVLDEAGLEEFARLPMRLHGRGRHVPVLRPTLQRWLSGEGAHAVNGPVRLALARAQSGSVVGRICWHHDPAMDEVRGEDVQLFGLTEFASREVLDALVQEVSRHARAAGRTELVGPVSLLPNQTGGVITSGFAERGFVDSPWNPEHYPLDYAALGFARIWEGQTWICEDLGLLETDAIFPASHEGLGEEGLALRHGSGRRLGDQLPILREMLNAAFAQLPYYTPISAEQLAEATDGLAFLIDERLVLWLERDGRPVAFVLVVPDISEFVMRHDGRMGWREQLALLATRRRYRREAILVIKGTVPDAQGRGYLSLLSRELLRGLQDGGYTTLRSTFVGLDNPASEAQYRRMGGRVLHGTTFYRRPVSVAASGRAEGSD